MKVENIHLDSHDGKPALVATVIWEDSDRPPRDIYFATLDRFSEYLNPSAEVFAVGCLLPALHHGEKRLSIETPLCPELRDGLDTVTDFMRMWFEPHRKPVDIEAPVRSESRPQDHLHRAALFFSGGIDSLAALKENHTRYPESHPEFFRDGILIYGQNVESDNRVETFEEAMSALSEITQDANISLLPVYTNLRSLDESTEFFRNEFHGAILGAVSHAVAGRLHSVSVSASDSIPGLRLVNRETFKPFGSHPMIDPWFSSHSLQIRHVGMTAGRLEKTQTVAEWPAALNNIRVCKPNWPGQNCGRCEKCLRTMLALTAVGALEQTRAFPNNRMTVESIQALQLKPGLADDYRELIRALETSGRPDLAKSLQGSIGKALGTSWSAKDMIKKADQKYLDGKLRHLGKRLRGRPVPKPPK